MAEATYNHLHVHTEYSLLDGANRISRLVAAAARDGQKALAITDHGNMYGALKFYNECKAQGVKPVLGCEFYVAMSSRFRKHSRSNGYNHLTLLARNEVGYRNLLKLTSMSFIEGLSYKPRIDHRLLSQYTEGITCLSGCLSGKVNSFILDDKPELACELAGELRDLFRPEHFWIEVQRNGLSIQDRANSGIIEIAKKLGAPIAATNDIHYERGEDCDFQDTVLCVNTGKKKADTERFMFETDSLYVKTQAEMSKVFRDMPDALTQTLHVADQVDLFIPQGEYVFPTIDTDGKDPFEILKAKTYKGIQSHYGLNHIEAESRAEMELQVIKDMGFPQYFLIVADFVEESKRRGIPVGPGRGSAAGSIVSYALGITGVDPLKHKLLFERFLNADRKSLPDIDIDFCKDRRGEVLDYLRERYGYDKVAQIITFGKFGPKAALRDAGRVYDVPLKTVNEMSRKLSGETIEESFAQDPSLKQHEKEQPEMFKTARMLEGMVKFAGTHACGVVVGDRPLYEIVPLARNVIKGESAVTTQWDLDDCEKIGLVKFDILGLEGLTTIEATQRLIEERHGQRVDLSSIDPNDPALYEMLGTGNSEGVFQCDSDSGKRLLIEMKPTRFEDLVAVIALNRPGPQESGIAKSYIERKHGREEVSYLHPDVEQFLSDTYGCMIYQEQIMQLATALAGFTMNEADDLRKAVGKKNQELLESLEKKWLKGCKNEKKISEEEASSLWADILKFGRYGFNKSHSASYAFLTLWTAYLRAHYLVEFTTANLTQEIDDVAGVRAFIRDANKHGLTVLAPDLRKSRYQFSVVDDSSIRMGLGSVSGLGKSFAESIKDICWPESDDLLEVLRCAPEGAIRKNTIEHLARAGMLDFCGADRGQITAKSELISKRLKGKKVAADSLFAEETLVRNDIGWEDEDIWSESEKLKNERDAFGFYLSGHPMYKYRADVWNSGSKSVSYVMRNGRAGENYKIAGMITEQVTKAVKNGKNAGKKYARLVLEDEHVSVTCSVFTRHYDVLSKIFLEAEESAKPVIVYGKLDGTGDEPQIIANKITWLKNIGVADNFQVDIRAEDGVDLDCIGSLLDEHPGDTTVTLIIEDDKHNHIPIRSSKTVDVTNEFIDQLEECLNAHAGESN